MYQIGYVYYSNLDVLVLYESRGWFRNAATAEGAYSRDTTNQSHADRKTTLVKP